jgi:RNA polymerase sigma-70 factor (ECF subfamily)
MRNVIDIHQDLVEQSKEGNRSAQKSLFDLYGTAMFNIGVRILGSKEDAADITQETFIDAFTKLDQFEYRSTFGAWIKKIMVNKSLNYLNRRKVHFDLPDDFEYQSYEDDHSDSEELMFQLNASLLELPEGCRVIFTLFYFEGLEHSEIATELQISVSTSKSQLSRAKKLLRGLLTQKVEA